MAHAEIKTLTPLHVGSGTTYKSGFEYLSFPKGLAVVDLEKVLDIIGPENIDKWMAIIENKQNLLKYLTTRRPGLKPEEVSKIFASFRMGGDEGKDFKGLLRTGMDVPLLPGSSIKGSLRTAFFMDRLFKNPVAAKRVGKIDRRGRYADGDLMRNFMGKDPNTDIFRFVQVGDAHFEVETQAAMTFPFNYRYDGWNQELRLKQLVEVIPQGKSASFELSIAQAAYEANLQRGIITFKDLSIKGLLKMVRANTSDLLVSEYDYWNDPDVEVVGAAQKPKDHYLDMINELIEQNEACAPNQAVMRIGFGSGWKFMTGNWIADTDLVEDEEYGKMVGTMRRKSYSEGVPYPKTRNLLNDGTPLGFVKISVNL